MTYPLPVLQPNAVADGRKPAWLKVRAPGGPNYSRLRRLMRDLNLHSVCEEAHCPNIGECWQDATATFMILGDVCTRNCGYCAVAHGAPVWEDREEPEHIGRAVAELGLEHVVITSVNRDDLADGGAAHWAATIRAVRAHAPACRVEVLVPDFLGRRASIDAVIAAGPAIFNHNTETVPRLYKVARHGGRYDRVLDLFRHARATATGLPLKSGIILGLGEEHDELVATMRDLLDAGVSILTLGQYLRPSPQHLPVARYYHPDEFAALAEIGRALGFAHVESGPLVRSSYHAKRQADAARTELVVAGTEPRPSMSGHPRPEPAAAGTEPRPSMSGHPRPEPAAAGTEPRPSMSGHLRPEPAAAGTEPRPSMSGHPRPEPASRHPLQ